nr:MAG TPA: hypothetical protein [Ackermannviridae sp.]
MSRRDLTTEELIKKMAWHVSREVKHYATDFEIDRAQLTEAVETGHYGQYIWITRNCGTHLVPVGIAATDPDQSAELLAAIRRTWSDAERREYCITLGPCSHSFQPLRQREARA